MFRLKTSLYVIGLLLVLLGLPGCAAQPAADTTPVRIAILPIEEGLPLYAAQDGGFFEKQGVKVEFISAGSAADRDQLIAAGQADGMINDLLAVALFNRQATQLQVVRFAHVSSPGAPLFVIVAALVLSLAGDVLLMLPHEQFVAGLSAFLVAASPLCSRTAPACR